MATPAGFLVTILAIVDSPLVASDAPNRSLCGVSDRDGVIYGYANICTRSQAMGSPPAESPRLHDQWHLPRRSFWQTGYIQDCELGGVPVPPDFSVNGGAWAYQGKLSNNMLRPREAAHDIDSTRTELIAKQTRWPHW
jgi:hypothetical protein